MMPSRDQYREPPRSIDDLNLTREVTALEGNEQYKTEEFTYVELGGRLVSLMRGNLVGTFELAGCPDVKHGRPDWVLVMTKSGHKMHEGTFYPFRFWGDERQALDDLFHLRLAV